jgi:hypothetical protein
LIQPSIETSLPTMFNVPVLAGTVTKPAPVKANAWFTSPAAKVTVPLAEPVSKLGPAVSLKLPSPAYHASMFGGAGAQVGVAVGVAVGVDVAVAVGVAVAVAVAVGVGDGAASIVMV